MDDDLYIVLEIHKSGQVEDNSIATKRNFEPLQSENNRRDWCLLGRKLMHKWYYLGLFRTIWLVAGRNYIWLKEINSEINYFLW